MKSLRVTKTVKEIKLERAWDKLEEKYCFQKQAFPKYLRLTLVFMQNSALQENFNFWVSLEEFFASINKIFISAGRLNTTLLFYEVLRLS